VNTLTIKALGPDNDVELAQIVQLVEKGYGDTFPIKSAYDLQFWKAHIGQRFTSIVAVKDGKIVGHIAAQPENVDPRNVQILFSLWDPELPELQREFTTRAWEILRAQSKKKSWQMIYSFVFDNTSPMRIFTSDMIKCNSLAICPGYFPGVQTTFEGSATNSPLSKNGSRTDIVVVQKVLSTPSEARELFIPARHQVMVERLYKPLGLKRTFARKPRTNQAALQTDLAVERECFARSGICQFFITPSLLAKDEDPLAEVINSSLKEVFIFVNALDPKCPDFCEKLEESGYKFCGALPMLRGRDSLIYYQESLSGLDINHYTISDELTLAHYITTYESSSESSSINSKINGYAATSR
jgi:hypothetical protein